MSSPISIRARIEAEGDTHDFTAFGLSCALRRGGGESSHWCGYVGIPWIHPLYGRCYTDYIKPPKHILERELQEGRFDIIDLFCQATSSKDESVISVSLCFDVHGGITWAKSYAGGPSHKDAGLWWFGFDCAHIDDWTEYYTAGVYRDLEYVKNECRSLAQQLRSWPLYSNFSFARLVRAFITAHTGASNK